MSAHAISCRRTDLAEFLTILFEVLTPLFAFLSEERWTTPVAVPTPVPEPVPPASGSIPVPRATPVVAEVAAVLPVEVAPAPVATLAVVAEVRAVNSTPTTDTPTDEPEPISTPDADPKYGTCRPAGSERPARAVREDLRPLPPGPDESERPAVPAGGEG